MNKKTMLILAGIVLFALLVRMVFFTGIGTSDSLTYSQYSYEFSKGEYDTGHKLADQRIGLFLPVSVLYRLFGVSDFSSNVFVLVLSLGMVILAFFYGQLLFNEKTGLIASFLIAIFPLNVFYSTRLMTDLPAAFFSSLAVFLFLFAELKAGKGMARWYYVLSGISMGIANSIREITVLMGFFFLLYVIYNKKFKKAYFLVAAGFFIIFALELLFFYSTVGNPFVKFEKTDTYVIDALTETNFYERKNFPKSLFLYPYIMFGNIFVGYFYLFIFLAVLYSIFFRKRQTDYLLMWIIPILLYLNFGTLSWRMWLPLPAVIRYLAIITIPGMLLLAYFLAREDKMTKKVLLPYAILFLLATSMASLYLNEERHSKSNLAETYEFLGNSDKLVFSDERSIRIMNYLASYQLADTFQTFHNYEALNKENNYALNLTMVSDSYVIVNWDMIDFFLKVKKDILLPDEIYSIPEEWELQKTITNTGERGVEIYYVP